MLVKGAPDIAMSHGIDHVSETVPCLLQGWILTIVAVLVLSNDKNTLSTIALLNGQIDPIDLRYSDNIISGVLNKFLSENVVLLCLQHSD